MGASSSTEQVSPEQREAESLAASTGALTVLEKAFSNLEDPVTKTISISSLKECFKLSINYPNCEAPFKPETFPTLLNHLGDSILDHFFLSEKDGLNWISFLNSYTKCCGRMPTSTSLNNLLKVFASSVSKSGATTGLQIESTDAADYKINGYLLPADLLMLFWMCWVMCWSSRNQQLVKENETFGLPDVNNLVLSAVSSCAENGAELNVWDDGVLGSDRQINIGKLHVWVLKTVPNLPECLVRFVHSRLSNSASQQDISEPLSSSTGDSYSIAPSSYLLTPGRAWAISLTLRSTMRDEILKTCFAPDVDEVKENLLYRSSLHGKGLSRFWSNVEGYNGPILVLISATSEDRSWSIGALTHQGFENKDTFYGTSGSLYTITPVFNHLTSSGKEKNFVYSHLHSTGYEAKPKPVGIAFGGSIGNERVFMDEDFSKLTVRHHTYDKTYQPGALFPNQGYLPTEAQILEVEVWGLGGVKIREAQNLFLKREQLFTEQRRKVDLKTFSNWEDSPEKMMMDMVSNPNAVRREER